MLLGTKYGGLASTPENTLPEACQGCIVGDLYPARVGRLCIKVVTAKLNGALTAGSPSAGSSACKELIMEEAAMLTPASLALHDVIDNPGPARF